VKQYFASLETNEFLGKACEKINDYNTYMEKSGKAARLNRAEDRYFGKHQGEIGVGSYTINDAGIDGEMSAVPVNIYRSLIKHTLSYVVSQKPSWDPRAKNSDTRALQQTRLASNILDAYMTEKRLGRPFAGSAERASVGGNAFLYMTWNPAIGKPIAADPQTGKVAYEGDVEACVKSARDVISDSKVRDNSKHKWRIVREFENKWDLAARHTDKAEEIINISAENDDLDRLNVKRRIRFDDQSDSDIIPVYHFYHIKSDGMPSGRYCKFLNGKTWLYDGPIQYRRLPLFRIAPGDEFDTADGYTDSFDILALTEAVNVLMSVTFSNLQAFAGQKLWLPEGCDILPSAIDDGMMILKGGVPGSEPKILNLTGIPPEMLKVVDLFMGQATQLMGLNSVVTGDPEHNLKSGAALGRMQAMAIQYASNFQKSWAELCEDGGTFLLELMQDFAKSARMIALGGSANKGAMQSFTGQDLDLIERVAVDLGNPMQKTAAGRIELADNLLQKGEITPKEYMEVIATGSVDAFVEQEVTDVELVQKENELLRDGKPVQAMVGDGHLYHMDKHRSVMNDPQLREAAARGDQLAIQIIQATTQHIMEHNQLYHTQDPTFSVIAKEPPAPQPPPPPMPPGPGAPPPEGSPPPPQGPPPGAPAQPPPIPPMAA
jgi:hypothetical protein